jgi:hypothetical protein
MIGAGSATATDPPITPAQLVCENFGGIFVSSTTGYACLLLPVSQRSFGEYAAGRGVCHAYGGTYVAEEPSYFCFF